MVHGLGEIKDGGNMFIPRVEDERRVKHLKKKLLECASLEEMRKLLLEGHQHGAFLLI